MIFDIIHSAFLVYSLAILVVVVASWIPALRTTAGLRDLTAACDTVTEPYLRLWRRILPGIGAGGMTLDLSPMLGLIALQFLEMGLVSLLVGAGV
jgi:YggT family protein